MINGILLFWALCFVGLSVEDDSISVYTETAQANPPLQIIRLDRKEYVLNKSVPIDSIVKKEWVEDVLIVKKIETTKYRKDPQSKFGVLVFLIKKTNRGVVLRRIREYGLQRFPE
ncbi:hypothetical protein [Pedobacter sp. SYP-B3415]|uniref:hypothetical protein n=1 Tax=Pedobacter sp. SYP-B3415 TaxID=2496641 RepID=UPI00101DC5CA|nr:hypothetical protein [Pedobacter sp. SYP-B3415]